MGLVGVELGLGFGWVKCLCFGWVGFSVELD